MRRSTRVIGLAMIAVAVAACGPRVSTAASSRPSATASSCPQSAPGKPCATLPTPTAMATPAAIAYLQPSSVSFVDAQHGWAVGHACDAQGTCRPGIARTEDGGATWVELPPPAQRAMAAGQDPWPSTAAIRFISLTDGWLFNPFLAHSVDGGRTWKMVSTPTDKLVTDMVTLDASIWALINCSSDAPCAATLWRAPPAGAPFQSAGTLPPDPGTEAVVAGARLILYEPSAEQAGYLAVTSDGRSWAHIPSPCGGASQQLASSPSGSLIDVCWEAVGGGWGPKAAWSSMDGGSHWALRSRSADFASGASPVGRIPQTGYPNDIAMPTSLDAWMSMGREDLYETHDGGTTWSASAVPGQFAGNAGGAEQVLFVDARHGWALGSEGLFRTTDGHSWTRVNVLGPVPGYGAP
jgi:hypothetical protein